MSQSFYQIGGSLSIFAPTYVKRQADRDLYEGLKNSEFCYVFSARQTGKSSLMIRTMDQLREEGIKCVAVDLRAIGTSDLSAQEWYAGIMDQIVTGLALGAQFDFYAWWHEYDQLSNIHRVSKFFDEVLLSLIPENIVIFIDEIETIFSLDFKVEDFFVMIRECFNKRNHSVNHQRLTFALFGVACHQDLIKEQKRSPFAIGKAINLTGFSLTEAYPLLEGLKNKSAHPQRLLQSILFWTNGQPFLCQKLCDLVAKSDLSFPFEYEAELIENIVRSQIIKNWQTQDEPEHLKWISNRLIFSEKTLGKLLSLYQEILENGGIKKEDNLEQKELILTGLVTEYYEKLTVTNPIYLAVFNPEWVKQELENLRPYSQSIIPWLASQGLDTSRLLRGQALQEALYWAKEKNLSYQDYQFLTASQEYELGEAQQILELRRKALEAEQFKIEARQNQRDLELAHKENKLLAQQQVKAEKKIKISQIALLISLATAIPLGGFLFTTKQEKFLLKTNQIVNQAQQQFQFAQIEGLITAMKAGQDFQTIYDQKVNFGKNPIYTPMFILRPILDNIQEKNQLNSHQGAVTALNFSPDGQYLASGSRDNTVKIWDLKHSKYINLTEHQAPITAVEFSPNGQFIASASVDRTVKIWNKQGNLLKNITDYETGVNALSFSPDGQYLVTVALDNRIKIWDQQGNLYQSFQAKQGQINALSVSPDRQFFATGSEDQTVKIWTIQGQLKFTLNHDEGVLALNFSPRGDKLATITKDNFIYIWDNQGKLLKKFRGHQGTIRNISFHPDGAKIATVGDDLTLRIWDLEGNLLINLRGHQEPILTVTFSPDGQTLATGSQDHKISLWTLQKPDQSLILKGHGQGLTSVAFSPDGRSIATTSGDRTVRLWNQEGQQTQKITHPQKVNKVAFFPDGESFLTVCEDGLVRLWNKEGQLLKEFKEHSQGIMSLKISADGEEFLTTSRDHNVILWGKDGKIKQVLTGHEGIVYDGDFSRDKNYLVTVSDDGTIRLWDQKSRVLQILAQFKTTIKTVKFSPDQKFVITGSSDGVIRLINLKGKVIKEIQAHYSPINQVQFSPDGKIIASVSVDGLVRLWNLNGDGLGELRGHESEVSDLVFSPIYSEENPYLLTASGDQTARLWRIENLDQLLTRGCNWLGGYFVNHPETLKKLQICRS